MWLGAGLSRAAKLFTIVTMVTYNPCTVFSSRAFADQSSNIRRPFHYNDIIMGTIASQITSLTIVYSTVYSGADQRKHKSSASLAFVRKIHRGSPHKWPVRRKMFPFDDVIMLRHKFTLQKQASTDRQSSLNWALIQYKDVILPV